MPNVKQDFLLVITEINKLKQELVASQKAAKEHATTVERGAKSAVSGFDQAKRAARDYATEIERANKSTQQFGSSPAAAANSGNIANTTKLMNQQRFAVFQLTSGFQDAAIAFQMMGNTAQGWGMAMRGASNNLGVMLSTMGPFAAIAGTIALAVGPPLIAFFYNLATSATFAADSIERIGDRARQTTERLNGISDALKSVSEAQRELDRASKPEEERKSEVELETAKAEELRSRELKDRKAFEVAKSKFIADEVEKRTGKEVESARIRQAAQEGAEKQMIRGAVPSAGWRFAHEGFGGLLGPTPPEHLQTKEWKEETERRKAALSDQLERYRTEKEVDDALKKGKLEFGQEEADLIKSRIRTEKETADVSKKVLETNKSAIDEVKTKISRGEVIPGMPVTQEEIDSAAEEHVKSKEHGELVKKSREVRKKLDTARDQESKDVLQEQARPLEERSQEIRRELGLSSRERALLHLPKLTKRERARLELEQQGIGQQLEGLREQEKDIGIQAHERERARRGIGPGQGAEGQQGEGAAPVPPLEYRSLPPLPGAGASLQDTLRGSQDRYQFLSQPVAEDKQMQEQTMHLRRLANTFAFGFANTINRNAQL